MGASVLPPSPTKEPQALTLSKALTEGHVWVGVAAREHTPAGVAPSSGSPPGIHVGLGYVGHVPHAPGGPHRGQLGGCPLRGGPLPPPSCSSPLEPLPSAAESCEVPLTSPGKPCWSQPSHTRLHYQSLATPQPSTPYVVATWGPRVPGLWGRMEGGLGGLLGWGRLQDSHSLPLHQLHVVLRARVVLCVGAQGPPEVRPGFPWRGQHRRYDLPVDKRR